jgi:hypothetical protein
MKAMREHYYRQLERAKGLIEFIDFTLLKSELNMSFETIQYLKQKREGYIDHKEYCLNKITEHEND